jgi:hypothetical protein
MAKLSSISSDLSREMNGVPVTYPGTDIVCTIARLGNPDYDAEAKKIRKFARTAASIGGGELSERESKDILAPAVAKHILLDMKNAQDDNGADVTYTPAYGEQLLKDPRYHDFYDWVLVQSKNAELFAAGQTEVVRGNSSPASNGG